LRDSIRRFEKRKAKRMDGFTDAIKGKNIGKGSAKSVDKGACCWVGRNGVNVISAIALSVTAIVLNAAT
jgi:hypothetical protein